MSALDPSQTLGACKGPVSHRMRLARALIAGTILTAAAVCKLEARETDSWKDLKESFREMGAGPGGKKRATVVRTNLRKEELDTTMEIEVPLRMRRFEELQARLAARETIPAAELDERYYPLAEDYDQLVRWLEDSGLTITQKDPARLAVFAEGPVSRMASLFRVPFSRVTSDGAEFSSATAAPSIPAALLPAILGINGLQPHLRPAKHLSRMTPAGNRSSLGTNFTSSYDPPFLPHQIAKAYDADNLGFDGTGQTIGIVIDTFPADSDLTAFWNVSGVSQSLANIEKVQVVAGTLPATSGEETLDVAWSSAMAAGSKVRVYATRDLSFVRIDRAYAKILAELPAQPGLRQVSLSFGLGETYAATAQLQTDAQYFASLAAAGVTVFVSSGDGGSSPGPGGHDHTGPVQTETPASDPSVTAVGGTTLYLNSTTGEVLGESAWYDGGGGISTYFARPAWQTGLGVPGGGMRLVPDVALVGDGATGGYLVWNGGGYIVGGTSWSAPVWAAFCAQINQSRIAAGLSSVGLLGPKVFPLQETTALWDVVTGTNGPNGVYSAGDGFDLCTGVGVPNMRELLNALTPRAPTLTGSLQNQVIVAGETAHLSVIATGSPSPAYQWQVSLDGGATWTNLSDTGFYSGSHTATLSISPAGPELDGARYRCAVSNSQGATTSNIAVLTVTPASADVPAMPPWALVALAASLVATVRKRLN